MGILLLILLLGAGLETSFGSPKYIEQAGDKVTISSSDLYRNNIVEALKLLAEGKPSEISKETVGVGSDKEYAEKDLKDDASENSAQDGENSENEGIVAKDTKVWVSGGKIIKSDGGVTIAKDDESKIPVLEHLEKIHSHLQDLYRGLETKAKGDEDSVDTKTNGLKTADEQKISHPVIGQILKSNSKKDHKNRHKIEQLDKIKKHEGLHKDNNSQKSVGEQEGTADEGRNCPCKIASKPNKQVSKKKDNSGRSSDVKGGKQRAKVDANTKKKTLLESLLGSHKTDVYALILPLRRQNGKLTPFKPDIPISL